MTIMYLPEPAMLNAPYGLAFPIEELELVNDWAAQRKLRLHVAVDQVLDGFEFEEMLIIGTPRRQRRCLTLWRTRAGVFGQSAFGRPRPYLCVQQVLDSYRAPTPQRGAWLRMVWPA
jgi:hypothetical protein